MVFRYSSRDVSSQPKLDAHRSCNAGHTASNWAFSELAEVTSTDFNSGSS